MTRRMPDIPVIVLGLALVLVMLMQAIIQHSLIHQVRQAKEQSELARLSAMGCLQETLTIESKLHYHQPPLALPERSKRSVKRDWRFRKQP